MALYSSLHCLSRHVPLRHSSRVNFTNAVLNNDMSIIFPTHITAIIGQAMTIKLIAMCPLYYRILDELGFTAHRKNMSIDAMTYYLYGEFLRNIMIPSLRLRQYMHTIYPNYDKDKYCSIHLRFGGKLADVPVSKVFLKQNSVNTTLQCIKLLPKHCKLYIASDSLEMKNRLLLNLTDYERIYTSNKTIPADTQMLKSSLVSYATFTAVGELYILGHGRHCIMTPGSTYSLAMCAMTGAQPISVMSNKYMCDNSTFGAEINFLFCSKHSLGAHIFRIIIWYFIIVVTY